MAGVILIVKTNEQITPIIIVKPTVRIGTIGEINNAENPIESVKAHRRVAFPVLNNAKYVAFGISFPSSLNSTIRFAICNP